VAEANIVDRCESCHIGIREPLKLDCGVPESERGEGPRRLRPGLRQPPRLQVCCSVHDPDKFGCSPATRANGRATTQYREGTRKLRTLAMATVYQANVEAGCQTCHAADMVLISGEVG